MASPTKCPSCGSPVALPKGYHGGPITCPNPSCGKTFDLQKLGAAPVSKGRPRPASSRPELLERIELGFTSSPAMFAVGAVVALLYGMVLFAAASGWKKQREAELANQPPPPEQIAAALPSSAHAGSNAGERTSPTPVTPKAASGTPEKEPPRPPEPAPAPEPEKSTKVAEKSTTRPEPPRPPAVPKTPEPPAPPPTPAFEGWGALKVAAAAEDCDFRLDGSSLVVGIPGTLHLLNPQLAEGNKTAPRLLTDVRGDFVAAVKVAGSIRPGTTPLPNLPFPFQGAGLLLWQDERNYLRLERSSLYSPQGKRLHQVLVELCRDGKTLPSVLRDVSDADLLLRFDRRGNEVRCAYSPDDGKTWLEVKRQPVFFPAAVRVGVSASNASPQRFAPEFQAWDLSGADGKRGTASR